MKNFYFLIKDKLVSHNKFQKIFCMTTEKRKEDDLLGPYELLDKVKYFIVSQKIDEKKIMSIKNQNKRLQIPYKIMFSYNILKLIINNSWRR